MKKFSELTLMSLYALDAVPMMLEDGTYTWEDSYAREFLNGEFYKKAFSAAEKAKILEASVENKPNPLHGTPNGGNTVDRVYLPDFDEILSFYGIDTYQETAFPEVFAHATPYTMEKGVWLEIPDSSKCWWWLRSSGGSDANAAEVGSMGYISYNGTDANDEPLGGGRGLRPVIRVKTN